MKHPGEARRKITMYIFRISCYNNVSMRRVGRPGQLWSRAVAGGDYPDNHRFMQAFFRKKEIQG